MQSFISRLVTYDINFKTDFVFKSKKRLKKLKNITKRESFASYIWFGGKPLGECRIYSLVHII